MDNSVYITLSRQTALLREMDVTAGNIANTNTTGYGAEHIVFSSYLTKDVNQGQTNPMAFAHGVYSYRDTENGPIKATGNPLDLAIQGQGYFAVETPLGTRYTRAGNFQVDTSGTLVNAEGYPVLDNSGQQIQFPEDAVSIEVGEAGNVKVNSEDFATIGVMQFENEQLLERLNGSLFASDIQPLPAEGARVLQGSLEGANVQPVLELTHLIKVSRAMESTAKFVETIYDLQRKTANAWAKQG
jgi:flagellar basal-body rod protein FlgF